MLSLLCAWGGIGLTRLLPSGLFAVRNALFRWGLRPSPRSLSSQCNASANPLSGLRRLWLLRAADALQAVKQTWLQSSGIVANLPRRPNA
jgi:hypothetical protein